MVWTEANRYIQRPIGLGNPACLYCDLSPITYFNCHYLYKIYIATIKFAMAEIPLGLMGTIYNSSPIIDNTAERVTKHVGSSSDRISFFVVAFPLESWKDARGEIT